MPFEIAIMLRPMRSQPIHLKNVRVHNLKGVDLTLQKNSLIVFTGVSGSGKSSLAFDTIYIEGQRRYVESLSAHARRFMGNLPKPEADLIEGISPTIAIEQKNLTKNPRSTVGTITGIYDYLRILFSKVGTPHCPVSGEKITPQSREQIVSTIKGFPKGSKLIILAPQAKEKKGEFKDLFEGLMRKGFMRIRLDQKFFDLTEKIPFDKLQKHDIDLVIDRLVLQERETSRLTEAVFEALEMGKGVMSTLDLNTQKETLFSEYAYAKKSGISYPPLKPSHFSFNHPLGMCQNCEGMGIVHDFDLGLIIEENLSIKEGCCSVAGAYNTVKWGNIYDNLARLHHFSLEAPWKTLSQGAKDIFLYGNKEKWSRMRFVHPQKKSVWTGYIRWKGVLREAKDRLSQATSSAHRLKVERLMHETLCPICQGARLDPYPAATQLAEKRVNEITNLTIEEAFSFFKKLALPPFEAKIAKDLLKEIQKRLKLLLDVGLHYLSLDRRAPTLSGGEARRVRLAAHIGSGLVGTTYVLDEPSIGLHPRDQAKLIKTLETLRDQGNTLIVVEHDQETMEAADHLVDIGPKAGVLGGEIVASGSIDDLIRSDRSITGAYLAGKKGVPIPQKRRRYTHKTITIEGASHHNLKNITANIPLEMFVALTGVSGSGKSSLIIDTLYPATLNALQKREKKVGLNSSIKGIEHLNKVIAIDQSAIGRTPRSNPSTYVKVFDAIRDLFADLPKSRAQGFTSGRFSFNVAEGSCHECRGMGMVQIDMDFLEDVWSECPTCEGKRFDSRTLAILYKGKSIHDVLEMSVEEAAAFFEPIRKIRSKLDLLLEVGLGYMKLGQSSTTLSGGEAQRVKLAKELVRPAMGKTLYILDEPTTGLHFDDISKLIKILHMLCELGNSVLVIEHHIDLIKTADWVIDLGPEGGKEGGQIIASGTPEEIAQLKTATGVALKKSLNPQKKAKSKRKQTKISCASAIEVRGASQNNLKKLSLEIPREKISVCTGPSGSGKSSLAFDTLYAEGQRRYISCLSPYARQFVKQMPKPHFDQIDNLSPAIAIEQKRQAGNPRSTVGTMTEIYDFLRLLYAHAGVAYCPETGEKIESVTHQSIAHELMKRDEKTKLRVMIPLEVDPDEPFEKVQERLVEQGFLHVRLNQIEYTLESKIPWEIGKENHLFLIIDRLLIRPGIEKRLIEAIEQASKMTDAPFVVETSGKDLLFKLSFSVKKTGKTYPPITPKTFSFNADEGMCPHCLGLGFEWGANLFKERQAMNLSPTSLMKKLWKEERTEESETLFFKYLKSEKIDPRTPLWKLPLDKLEKLMFGSSRQFSHKGITLNWSGINRAFTKSAKTCKKQLRDSLTSYLEQTVCIVCKGSRLNPLARKVEVNKTTISALCALPLHKVLECIRSLSTKVDPFLGRVLEQIENRLDFLCNIGLDYLSLDRKAPSLSGGETQRIHLASQLGSGLTGCLYVLDEPTIGLHPHNSRRLEGAVKKLSHLGNTLLITSHNPQLLSIADHIFEFGPKGGNQGGKIVAVGTLSQIKSSKHSLTGQYLTGKKRVPIPEKRRKRQTKISITQASIHNLKNITVDIPTQSLTCLTGLSGSGKSTLMHDLLKKGVQMHLACRSKKSGILIDGGAIEGLDQINKLISIDQNPIGHTIRADVSTYSEILKPLRDFYAQLPESKMRGLKAKHFSYNHFQGMCRTCWGLGFKRVDLQFLPSLKVKCDACQGNRLNQLSLEVTYRGRNLGQLLNLTIDEAVCHLPPIPEMQRRVEMAQRVGLGHLVLGQGIATLSNGEAGRLRLARELSKRETGKTLYLFDEPTVGLHYDDIAKLIPIFQSLVDRGNTLLMIEHNVEILKNADHLIEMGPEGGEKGGQIVAVGTPEELAKHPSSHTANYLEFNP